MCLLCSVVYLRQNTAETTAYNSVSNNIEYWLGNHAWEMSFPFKTCINGLKVYIWASLVAQLVKNPTAMRETWVWSLGWEDPLEKGKAIYSSILAWRIPWTLQPMGSWRVGHNWETFTFNLHFCWMSMLLLLSRFSRVWLCATPQTVAHQAPPSLGFSRQEHWSGLPFPSPLKVYKTS